MRPEWANAQAALASVLSTGDGLTPADVREAVALAERANATTARKNAAFLDILAGALAASGDLTRAVATGREGVDIAERSGDKAAAAAMRSRLTAWEAGHR